MRSKRQRKSSYATVKLAWSMISPVLHIMSLSLVSLQKVAKAQAEKRYREILETSGLSDDFVDRKARLSFDSDHSVVLSPRAGAGTDCSYDSESELKPSAFHSSTKRFVHQRRYPCDFLLASGWLLCKKRVNEWTPSYLLTVATRPVTRGRSPLKYFSPLPPPGKMFRP